MSRPEPQPGYAHATLVLNYSVATNTIVPVPCSDFPHCRDEAFIADANDVIADMIRRRGGDPEIDNYIPGDMHTAAEIVTNRWKVSGKLKSPNGNGKLLTEVVCRPTFGDVAANEGGHSCEGTATFDGLYDSDAERKVAREAMKNLGVSEKDWIRNVQEARREDPSYGR